MLRFDHIGIVVRDIETEAKFLLRQLPITCKSQRFDDFGLGVSVQFFREASGTIHELISPLHDKSPVLGLLKGNGSRIGQMAYFCDDLELAIREIRSSGAVPLGRPSPALAFAGKNVMFFWSPTGFQIELIESGGDARRFRDIKN
jgi:methylmalonyl-CoA/ethylmalonyl-CoA epimerase